MNSDIQLNIKVHSFLNEGIYQVEYYRSREVTIEQKQILQKLSKLIETNSKTQKYFRQMEQVKKPTYNSNIGISRQEFNSLIVLFSDKKPEKFNGTLTVIREENIFKFKGDKKLSLLDSVIVNVNSNSASFKQYGMNQVKDSINFSEEMIPRGDTLELYEFYRGPDGILGLTGLNGTYKLLIGKLNPSGRTYISFFARQSYDIEQSIPEFITVIFNK